MVRIVMDPEERRIEIMDVSRSLFISKGYDRTSVNDIIQQAGIAKGTFYYYFKSKDEILDAVIERSIASQAEAFMKIVNDSSLNALKKIRKIFYENEKVHGENTELLEYLHRKENIVMHQKSLVQSVKKLTPVISRIIRQGIDEGLFNTPYPLELTEFILVGMSFLFDPSIFERSREEYAVRLKALQYIMEKTLGAEEGSFAFLNSSLKGMDIREDDSNDA